MKSCRVSFFKPTVSSLKVASTETEKAESTAGHHEPPPLSVLSRAAEPRSLGVCRACPFPESRHHIQQDAAQGAGGWGFPLSRMDTSTG